MSDNCINSSLDLYTIPLNEIKLKHIYRRVGFGAQAQDISNRINSSADNIVNEIISQALNSPGLSTPVYVNYTINDYPSDNQVRGELIDQEYNLLKRGYIDFIFSTDLLGKLSFFWSNHFVTDYTSHFWNAFQWEYIDCLIRNSLGNFKTFTSEIGLTNAMLFYLDSAFSQKDNPNENFARELFELFTLGEGNGYTQQDIVETSRALTGYFNNGNNYVQGTKLTFNANFFDNTNKTIFGRTGNWDYYDVIDILFEEKGELIAEFICKKLYEFFVHPNTEGNQTKIIISELAQIFINNNFEILPVLRTLLKSEHFFDDNALGVQIRSPYHLHLSVIKEIGFPLNDSILNYLEQGTRAAGQIIFSPPDVAGWQRDRNWINTNFIIARWNFSETIIRDGFFKDNESLKNFAMNLTGDLGITSNNPDIISRIIIDSLLIKGLRTEEEYTQAYVVFRGDVSDTYYEGGATPIWTLYDWPTATTQVYNLLVYLSKEPEFQLT